MSGCCRLTSGLQVKAPNVLSHGRYRGHRNAAYKLGCCITNTDSCVVGGSEDGMAFFWDLVDAKVLRKLRVHDRAVSGIAYHPELPLMVTASFDGTAKVWADRLV